MANDELDRRLIASLDTRRVVVLPTADAFEHPERLLAAAMAWAERLEMGIELEGLMVMRRAEALDEGVAGVVSGADAVYIVGDQPLHLRSVLKDTPLWDAIVQLLASGGLVVAVGGSADAMCDPMVDPRGGAFTLGLGLINGIALMTEVETWSPDRVHRTRKLAATAAAGLALVELPSSSAVVRTADGWERVGSVQLTGELPLG